MAQDLLDQRALRRLDKGRLKPELRTKMRPSTDVGCGSRLLDWRLPRRDGRLLWNRLADGRTIAEPREDAPAHPAVIRVFPCNGANFR
jgi:hypothetical protein